MCGWDAIAISVLCFVLPSSLHIFSQFWYFGILIKIPKASLLFNFGILVLDATSGGEENKDCRSQNFWIIRYN